MWTFILIVLGIFFVLKVVSGFNKYRAAINVLLAKYTFSNLDPASQHLVIAQVKDIMALGYQGITSDFINDRFLKLSEVELCLFMSLAMADLGIQPFLAGHTWHPIRNPFVALLNGKKSIEIAQHQLEKNHGVRIDLGR